MADLVFVDTNVLIYARDRRDAGKRERAAAWLLGLGRANRARINLQVLNELTNWILRNERHRESAEVQRELALLGVWGERPLDDQDVEIAWAVRERLGYQ